MCVCVCPLQVCVTFNPQSTLVATGSMDTTAKLWDVESGNEVSTLAVRISGCVPILFCPLPSVEALWPSKRLFYYYNQKAALCFDSVSNCQDKEKVFKQQ